nr:uncharacterized protein LOC110362660 [Columba livia]
MCWPLYLQLQSSWEQPQGSLWWSSADVEGRSPHRDAEALGVPAGCPGLRDKAALQAHALACWTLWAGLFFISQPSRYDSRRNLPTNQPLPPSSPRMVFGDEKRGRTANGDMYKAISYPAGTFIWRSNPFLVHSCVKPGLLTEALITSGKGRLGGSSDASGQEKKGMKEFCAEITSLSHEAAFLQRQSTKGVAQGTLGFSATSSCCSNSPPRKFGNSSNVCLHHPFCLYSGLFPSLIKEIPSSIFS